MNSQKHEDEMQQREQISSPVEEKHTTISSGGRSKQAPTSPRRWISVLLFIPAVALPLVAGSMVWWPLGGPYGFVSSTWGLPIIYGVLFLMVVVGAFLVGVFRLWWGLLIVPVTWIVGEILGKFVDPLLVEGSWPAISSHFWGADAMFIGAALVLTLICSFVGVECGIGFSAWRKKRQQRQRATAFEAPIHEQVT